MGSFDSFHSKPGCTAKGSFDSFYSKPGCIAMGSFDSFHSSDLSRRSDNGPASDPTWDKPADEKSGCQKINDDKNKIEGAKRVIQGKPLEKSFK